MTAAPGTAEWTSYDEEVASILGTREAVEKNHHAPTSM
jgi:hypothetical protein